LLICLVSVLVVKSGGVLKGQVAAQQVAQFDHFYTALREDRSILIIKTKTAYTLNEILNPMKPLKENRDVENLCLKNQI